MSVREGLPIVRGPRRRTRRARQGCGAGDSGKAAQLEMPTFPERLSRLAALRPAKRRPAAEEDFAARPADESDALARRLGAGVGKNRFGEHLVVQQWFSSPEPCGLNPEALRLLLPVKPRTPRVPPSPHEHPTDLSHSVFPAPGTTPAPAGR